MVMAQLLKDVRTVASLEGDARRTAVTRLSEEIQAGGQGGHFSVDKDIEFGKLIAELVPKSTLSDMRSSRIAENTRLWESALGVVTSSALPDLLGPLIRVGMWEICSQSPLQLGGLIPTERAGCRQEDFYGWHGLGDIVEESEDELEKTEYKGVPSPIKISQPVRKKKKFAFGLTREALCFDPDGIVRGLMRSGADSLNLHKEKLLADTVFALFPKTGYFRPYIENDVKWRTYYQQGGSPWINNIEGNLLDGTYSPFDVLEQHVEDMTDPFTGEPIDCVFRDIIVSNANARDKALQGLSVMQIAFDLNTSDYTGLNARAAIDRPANTDFGRITVSRYVLQRLRDWYQNVVNLDAADSLDAARATWAVGDFATAFRWVEEWPTETLERSGTNTKEYFDQEIIWQIKFLQKADPAVANPRKVIRMVPDLTTYTSYDTVYTWD